MKLVKKVQHVEKKRKPQVCIRLSNLDDMLFFLDNELQLILSKQSKILELDL